MRSEMGSEPLKAFDYNQCFISATPQDFVKPLALGRRMRSKIDIIGKQSNWASL